VAVLGVEPVELISGSLPRRQERLVEAWAELHQAELIVDGNGCRRAGCHYRSSRSSKEFVMTHAIYRVTKFSIVAPYTLQVSFDDNSEQRIDFRPILAGELYAPLRDIEIFNKVALDPEVHTLVWPNGADFDPATLHDWPQLKEAMTERASRWELVPETP
jgi:Protein of unknown function (DUF2442)/Domain of unknown function (DUF4160)